MKNYNISFGILDRYVGRNILVSVVVIAISLTLFTGLITLIDKTRYIGRGSVDFLFVCEYVTYLLPSIFVTFFPVAILLGGVIGLGMMARNSEIVILQGIGLSQLNIAMTCLKTLIPAILVVMAIGEYVVPKTTQYAETRLTEKTSQGKISVSASGIWLKEGNSFISISDALSDGSLINIVRYDIDGIDLKKEMRASRAHYDKKKGTWTVENVIQREYLENEVKETRHQTDDWILNLNPERVEVIGSKSETLTISGLIDYIGYLDSNKQDSSTFRLELYTKLISPIAMIVMLMLALSTVFGPQRSMSMGTRILAGIALGFSYYVLNQILSPISLVYGIPPIIGASMGTVVFGSLAIFLLNRKA